MKLNTVILHEFTSCISTQCYCWLCLIIPYYVHYPPSALTMFLEHPICKNLLHECYKLIFGRCDLSWRNYGKQPVIQKRNAVACQTESCVLPGYRQHSGSGWPTTWNIWSKRQVCDAPRNHWSCEPRLMLSRSSVPRAECLRHGSGYVSKSSIQTSNRNHGRFMTITSNHRCMYVTMVQRNLRPHGLHNWSDNASCHFMWDWKVKSQGHGI